DDVLDRDDEDEQPDDERLHAVDVFHRRSETALRHEALLQRVERARADVAVDDAERGKREEGKPVAGRIRLDVLARRHGGVKATIARHRGRDDGSRRRGWRRRRRGGRRFARGIWDASWLCCHVGTAGGTRRRLACVPGADDRSGVTQKWVANRSSRPVIESSAWSGQFQRERWSARRGDPYPPHRRAHWLALGHGVDLVDRALNDFFEPRELIFVMNMSRCCLVCGACETLKRLIELDHWRVGEA